VAHLVETLRYKPEGRGFDPRLCHWNFSLIISDRTMGQSSTQPLKAVVHRTLQTNYFHMLIVLKSGGLTSWNPQGLSRPVRGLLYFYLYLYFYCSELLGLVKLSMKYK
jgi:hypothetical protein